MNRIRDRISISKLKIPNLTKVLGSAHFTSILQFAIRFKMNLICVVECAKCVQSMQNEKKIKIHKSLLCFRDYFRMCLHIRSDKSINFVAICKCFQLPDA